MPAFVGTVTLRYCAAAHVAIGRAVVGRPPADRAADVHKLSSQLTIAAVAAILGLLVVVQFRSQAGDAASPSCPPRT